MKTIIKKYILGLLIGILIFCFLKIISIEGFELNNENDKKTIPNCNSLEKFNKTQQARNNNCNLNTEDNKCYMSCNNTYEVNDSPIQIGDKIFTPNTLRIKCYDDDEKCSAYDKLNNQLLCQIDGDHSIFSPSSKSISDISDITAYEKYILNSLSSPINYIQNIINDKFSQYFKTSKAKI